jgi:hypothetical protein
VHDDAEPDTVYTVVAVGLTTIADVVKLPGTHVWLNAPLMLMLALLPAQTPAFPVSCTGKLILTVREIALQVLPLLALRT